MQRRADAPDHRTHILAACGSGVHQAAGSEGADDARYTDFACQSVHAHLYELCAQRIHEFLTMRAAAKSRLAGIELLYGIRLRARWQEFRIFLDRAKL